MGGMVSLGPVKVAYPIFRLCDRLGLCSGLCDLVASYKIGEGQEVFFYMLENTILAYHGILWSNPLDQRHMCHS